MKRMEEEMKAPLNRRNFLKLTGAVGLGLSPLALATPVREMFWGSRLASATRMRPLMGTFVTVTVLDESKGKAIEAMEAAFAEMDRLIPLLDRHSPETPISYLNRTGRLNDIAPEVHEVLARAEHFNRQTYGMFDVTVKPLLDLFENHFSKANGPPPMEEVMATLKRVGAKNLSHGQREIRFLRDGMEITLDGIAKGYIVDRAISRLKAKGTRNALINAGGDIRALGDKGHGRPWKIAIQDPGDKTRYLQIIPLRDGAIATSGNYEIFFDPEKKFHHIVDPKTGISPQTWTSASILASSLADADALATAGLILSREIVLDVIRAVPKAQAIWVDAQGAMTRSSGWPIA